MSQFNQGKRVSLVVSVYNVEQYLPAFLKSLEDQTVGLSDVELVFVIDGSPDSSLALIQEWADAKAPDTVVVEKGNGGLSSARNAGMNQVTSEWVSFPDPDDILVPKYMESVFEFLDANAAKSTDLLAANLLILNDTTGEVTNTHPLRVRFEKRLQVVELQRHPNFIHLSAATGFYRSSILKSHNLEFDSRVKPNFEDAHFTARYLFKMANPRVAMIRDAEYLYRKREDGSSLVQTSWQKPEKYIDLPKYGYLNILESAKKELGYIPEWTQNLVLYDVFWYLREDDRMHSATANISPDLASKFFEYMNQIMAHIDTHVIADFRVVPTSWYHRQELIHKFKTTAVERTDISVNALDTDKQIVRLRYYFAGTKPVEEFRARGFAIDPVHETVRKYELFGHEMMFERIVWLPATGTLSLLLDGHRVPLIPGGFSDSPYRLSPARLWKSLAGTSVPVIGGRKSDPVVTSKSMSLRKRAIITLKKGLQRYRMQKSKADQLRLEKFARMVANELVKSTEKTVNKSVNMRLVTNPRVRAFIQGLPQNFDEFSGPDVLVAKAVAKDPRIKSLFSHAWLLMDRDTEAHDNAEHLAKYIAEQRTDINSWFILSQESKDWTRLEKLGVKMLVHGSFEHLVALMNAENLVSSQVDHYVVHPFEPKKYGRFPWKFTFLQHGVTKDDVSRWLNRKPIDLLVTASKLEYEEFTTPGGPYRFSSKETVLSGMPRFDNLYIEANRITSDERKKILIMPTWRRWLLGEAIDGGNLREKLGDFWDSSYARAWVGLLESAELKAYALLHDLEISFMPHPNMRPYLDDFPYLDHVEIFSYEDTDVQELIVRGSVLITDYSSIAFDGAFIDVPVIYFQFDREEFFSGNHVFRAGPWSYDEDGLGPVVYDQNAVLESLEDIASTNFKPSALYSERIQKTFPTRDSKSSERVVLSIEALRVPLTYGEAYVKSTSPMANRLVGIEPKVEG